MMSMLEAQLAGFQQTAHDSNATNAKAFDDIRGLTEEKCQLQGQLKDKERDLSNIESQLASEKEEHQKLHAHIAEMTSAHEEQVAQCTGLMQQLDAEQKEADDTQREMRTCEVERSTRVAGVMPGP